MAMERRPTARSNTLFTGHPPNPGIRRGFQVRGSHRPSLKRETMDTSYDIDRAIEQFDDIIENEWYRDEEA